MLPMPKAPMPTREELAEFNEGYEAYLLAQELDNHAPPFWKEGWHSAKAQQINGL